MENKNHTIKDIARMAGVSAGTVDRVLHNRGDVSKASREKVQKVLEQIDYHPNMFAIGLAAKKRYRIVCIIPHHAENDYWYAVTSGIKRAAEEVRPFNVTIDFLFYSHADKPSYNKACEQATHEKKTDAVLVAPNFHEETIRLTTYLEGKGIPYLFIDFNIEQTHALCYIGQDSRISGYMAAKILMREYKQGEEVVLFLGNQKDNPAEIQMRRRVEGFMKYVRTVYGEATIYDVVIQKDNAAANRQLLDDFFRAHPQARLGAAFNSRVYQIAEYLHTSNHRMKQLIGYDLLQKNVAYLKSGEVGILIGQRPGLQGYCGIKTLCNHVVFKKTVSPVRYMPIDILVKENIDFYFEFES